MFANKTQKSIFKVISIKPQSLVRNPDFSHDLKKNKMSRNTFLPKLTGLIDVTLIITFYLTK